MRDYLIFALACVILSGCATVQRPDVAVVDTSPQISVTQAPEAPARFLKRKVAIGRFVNSTKWGASVFYDANSDNTGKQAMDILSTTLGATGKFLLLERTDMDVINKELQMAGKAPLKVNADYVLIGSIVQLGRADMSDVGVLSRVKKQRANAKVVIRLADVYTGEIIYTEAGEGEAISEAGTVMGMGSKAAYDSTLIDKAISAAISKLTTNIINNLTERPWRAYILAAEGNGYIISGGKSQGLQAGDKLAVIKRGRQVKNPQTGFLVELPGVKVAEVVVAQTLGRSVNDEVSLVTLLSGNIGATKDFSEYIIQEEGGLQ
jgi:curli biogenesis system outer membrane secretion channel CsgG